VRSGQALIFSPYLIHGLALNETADVTRMALEFRFEIV
jgi:ectoine hydroxylase-related dioxygenase (phytanoyl-CoA dioxygenase family)